MLIKEVETSGIREVAEKQGPFFQQQLLQLQLVV